jgi:hypothetical protein
MHVYYPAQLQRSQPESHPLPVGYESDRAPSREPFYPRLQFPKPSCISPACLESQTLLCAGCRGRDLSKKVVSFLEKESTPQICQGLIDPLSLMPYDDPSQLPRIRNRMQRAPGLFCSPVVIHRKGRGGDSVETARVIDSFPTSHQIWLRRGTYGGQVSQAKSIRDSHHARHQGKSHLSKEPQRLWLKLVGL